MLESKMRSVWFLLIALLSGVGHQRAAAQEKPTVSIIGTGTLAGSLGPALGRAGYEVTYGSRNPDRETVRELVARSGDGAAVTTQREAASRTGIVILAVPAEVVIEVAEDLGDLDGKVLVDVSVGEKRLAPDGYLELIPDSTNSERLQATYPNAAVVRINLPSIVYFNDPLLVGTPPTVLIAGNDSGARSVIAQMIFDMGLDPWDAGPVRFSRVFDALNVMGLIPAQQGREEAYELRMMPSVPLSCILDMAGMFGFGQPNDLDERVDFPRRNPIIPCEEWMRRIGFGA